MPFIPLPVEISSLSADAARPQVALALVFLLPLLLVTALDLGRRPAPRRRRGRRR